MAEDLTCFSCHRLYEDPRLLSCLHSICFQCITKGSPVECPRCSTVTSSFFAFPVNVKLNRLVKEEAFIKKLMGDTQASCGSCKGIQCVALYYCPDCQDEFLCKDCYSAHQVLKFTRSHSCLPLDKTKGMSRTDLIAMSSFLKPELCPYHQKILDKYCLKCAMSICEECMTNKHKGHGGVGDSSIARDRESIKKSICTMEDSLKKAESSLAQGRSQENVHKTQRKSARDEITKAFNVLYSAIDKREQELLLQYDKVASDPDNRLKKFVSNVKVSVNRISESLLYAKDALEYTDEELVGISRVVSERATALDQELVEYSCNTNQITLDLNTKDTLKAIEKCGSLSKQVLDQPFSQTRATCTQANGSTMMSFGLGSAHPSKGLFSKSSSQGLVTLDQPFSQPSASCTQANASTLPSFGLGSAHQSKGLFSKSSSQTLDQPFSQPSATCTQANVSTLPSFGLGSARPSKGLVSKSSSQSLVTPPLQVFNYIDQCFRSSTQLAGIHRPKALAFDDDNKLLFFTSCSSEVFVINTNSLPKRLSGFTFDTPKKIGTKGTGSLEFLSPAGIAVDENLVYVTDEEANQVQVFTTAEKFVNIHGGKDSNVFSRPKDIKIGPDNKIYIADTGNYRVQVFNKDWTLSHKICYARNSSNSSCADTNSPHGISFDQSGDVHIVWRYTYGSPSITVHDKHGKCIRSYGSVCLNRGIAGIAINSRNCSYVLDGDIGFKVFSPKGEERYSVRNFNCPEGLTMNENGQVWVADTNNYRLATVEFGVRSVDLNNELPL